MWRPLLCHRNPCYTIHTMSILVPNLGSQRFSPLIIAFMFLDVWSMFVMMLPWYVSVILAASLLIAGVAGRIAAGTRAGFSGGIVFAMAFFLVACVSCHFSLFPTPELLSVPWKLWIWTAIIATATVSGGVYGGRDVLLGR